MRAAGSEVGQRAAGRTRRGARALLGVLVLAAGLAACGDPAPPDGPTTTTTTGAPAAVERLVPTVLAEHPHDTGAFTQGLVLHEGRLFESTGLVGRSSLREVALESGEVLRRVEVAPPLFAEGLAAVGDELVQLTWRDGVAIRYDRGTFVEVGRHRYEGEGWGLCLDGDRLVMSDGTDVLRFRDPASFREEGRLEVTLDGEPLARLNELECVDGDVWANVWQTDEIVRIDLTSGRVEAVVDAAGLLDPAEAAEADVLNGIAHDPADGAFLITGKLWPTLFRVRFEPAP